MTESILFTVLQDLLFIILLLVGGYFFGIAFYKIYKGEPVFFKNSNRKIEKTFYKLMGIDETKEMSVKKYVISLITFSLISFIFVFILLMLQSFIFLNPTNAKGMSWDLAFNTAISFVTNTNWQAYMGETDASYFSQMVLLTVQNFVSGAVGIAVLYALIRGFKRKESKTIGNFYVDIIRICLFMVPVCFVGSLLLVMDGVPQTLSGSINYATLDGNIEKLYLGPAASQIIIKQLFTNGGGFYGTNSAYPLENPTPFTNLIECLSLLLIPVGLCFTFGKAITEKNELEINNTNIKKHKVNDGIILLSTMTIIFVVCLTICTTFEYLGKVNMEGVYSIGNIEGKEVRFGVGSSSLWAVATTCASNGSVNAMHDSFTSIGGMIPMFLMMLGEIVYGGVGCGLYGMIAFAILTVFISGLMVGRTPEYLGKKIGSFDMKMVCLVILTPVLCLLLGSASTVILSTSKDWLTNSGAHGFSEILYAFSSFAGNNGSAFAGFNGNTIWTNLIGGIIMLVVRFIPMIAVLYLANSLGKKKIVPASEGTLTTNNLMFVGLLIAVILIIGALSFFPSLALGPIAEFVS